MEFGSYILLDRENYKGFVLAGPCVHNKNSRVAYLSVKRLVGLMRVATEARMLMMVGSSKVADDGPCTGRICGCCICS